MVDPLQGKHVPAIPAEAINLFKDLSGRVKDKYKDIKVGDLVSINPSRFAVKKHKEGSLKDGIITDISPPCLTLE